MIKNIVLQIKRLISAVLSIMIVLFVVDIPVLFANAEVETITNFSMNGEILQLPKLLKSIEKEAFRGDTSISKVIIPYGAVSIGSKAFAYSSLKEM